MKKCFLTVTVLVFLFSCAEIERDNPYDVRASNFRDDISKEDSSSSVKTGEPSSSSVVPSSGSVVPSSSSVSPSSSGTAPSSGSVEPSSSSSSSSSSSAPPSSSSEAESSSSVAQSSNSVPCTAGNNNSTHYCSEGTMKEYGFVTYDEQTYKTVVIGTQTWMAENLNYNADGSECYDNLESNCNTYGRLYDWSTAMGLESSCNSSYCDSQIELKHRGVCPAGWHIPSDGEWDTLIIFAGGTGSAGKWLKAASGWNSNNGTDPYGFSALPGGRYSYDSFSGVGDYGAWWSAAEAWSQGAYLRNMSDYGSSMGEKENYGSRGDKPDLISVRCVKD